MSDRPLGRARQIWASCSPIRWATARAVSSSGPISAAIAMTVGTTSLRHAASGAPPCLLVGAITEGMVGPFSYQPYVLRHTVRVATEMLGDIQTPQQAAADTALISQKEIPWPT